VAPMRTGAGQRPCRGPVVLAGAEAVHPCAITVVELRTAPGAIPAVVPPGVTTAISSPSARPAPVSMIRAWSAR
jgi:hypothetical protein